MKTRDSHKFVWAVAIIGIAGILAVLYATGTFSTTDGPATLPGTIITECSSEVTPDLNVKGYDIENPGTAITENFAYRKQGNIAWTTGTLGTELSGLEPGATYDFVVGIDASNGIDNPYGEMFSYTIKCQEDDSLEKPLYNDEVEASVTATFYNADNNAAAETYVAGQTQIVSVKFEAGSDEAFGNPFLDMPNILVLQLNSSQWDVPEKVYLDDGTELSRVDMPLRFDVEALGTTDYTEYAYEAPAVTDMPVKINLRLNADDSNAPDVDGTAYLFAGTHFITEDSEIGIGVETEEGVDIAVSDSDSVTLDFTA